MKRMLQLIGTAVCAWALGLPATASAQEKITYNMAWLPQGSSIGTIVAAQRGWFKEAGLDVDIVRGYGGGRTANELDQGQFEIGYVDPISLVLNRNNGGKIRLVGAINTQWPGGICYVVRQGHKKSLDDMRGCSLAAFCFAGAQRVPAWLEMNGKPRDFIRLVRQSGRGGHLAHRGQGRLAECWLASNWPLLRKQAKVAGVAIDWIATAISASMPMAAALRLARIHRKSRSRAISCAHPIGVRFRPLNPDQAADIAVKMFPTLIVRSCRADREINDLMPTPVASKGLGYLREDRMRSTLSRQGLRPERKDQAGGNLYQRYAGEVADDRAAAPKCRKELVRERRVEQGGVVAVRHAGTCRSLHRARALVGEGGRHLRDQALPAASAVECAAERVAQSRNAARSGAGHRRRDRPGLCGSGLGAYSLRRDLRLLSPTACSIRCSAVPGPAEDRAPPSGVWVGYGTSSKVLMAFLFAFFPVMIMTLGGLAGTPEHLVEHFRAIRASSWTTFRRLRLPAALPSIMDGCKTAMPLAVIGAIVGEFVGSQRGLGYLILESNAQARTDLLFAALVAISLLAGLLYWAIEVLARRVWWRAL